MQTLILIACYMNLFFMRKDERLKVKIPSIVLLTIDVVSIWLSREDAIWILPFCIFMSLIILIKNKHFWKSLFILLIPFITTMILCQGVRLINYQHYGVYTLRNEYWYNKAVKSIDSVNTDVKVTRVINTREKMNRIAEYTILREVIDSFNAKADGYAKLDNDPSDDEVENGWFKFVLTEAALENEYYETPQKANEFQKALYEDIEKAIEEGKLERSTDKKYGEMVLSTFGYVVETCQYIFRFERVNIDVYDINSRYRDVFKTIHDNFTQMSGNKTVWEKDSDLLKDGSTIVNFDEQDKYLDSIAYKTNASEFLVAFYKTFNWILAPIGAVYYIYLCVKLIKNKIKNFDNKTFENWVILSGMIGTYFTIVAGIAFTTYKDFIAITTLYLSAPFTLIIAFDLISVYNVSEQIYIKYKKVKERK